MSLINQMLKDIDKRHGAASSMSPSHHDLQGVVKSGLPARSVVWAGGLLVALGLAGVAVLKGQSTSPAVPVVLARVAPSVPEEVLVPSASLPSDTLVLAPLPPLPLALTERQPEQALVPGPLPAPPPSAVPLPVAAIVAVSTKILQPGTVSRVLTAEQRAENLYQDAVEQIRQGRMAQAQALLQQSLSTYPLHHASRQLLAQSMSELRQVEAARSVLQEGLVLAPQEADLYMALAHVHLANNDVDGAIQAMQTGLPVAADNAAYQAYLATLLQRIGRHDEAVQHYVLALRKTPDAANWLLGLAISLQAIQDLGSAAQAYQRAMTLGLSPSLMQFSQDRLRELRP